MLMPRHSCVGAFAFLMIVVGLLASGCEGDRTTQQTNSSMQAPSPPTPAPQSATVSATAWEPDPAILDKLGPYYDVKGYEVRVPKGWNLAPGADYSSVKRVLYEWHGPQRDDGTQPEFVVAWIVMQPSQKEVASGLDWLFDDLSGPFAEEGDENSKSSGHVTEKQSGQVNGVRFVRGMITKRGITGANTQSAFYVGRDGPTVVLLRFTDAQSHFKESAKLGVAAIVTFRKKA